jgi:hypothetical protein
LEAYITHCQLLQANGRKEPNLKDLITQTKVAMNIKNRTTVKELVLHRLHSNAAGTFKASKQYDQEARQIFWTAFCNLNPWFDGFENLCIGLGFAQRKANGSIGFIPPEQIFNLNKTNVSLDGCSGDRGGRPTTTFYMTQTCPVRGMQGARHPNSVHCHLWFKRPWPTLATSLSTQDS